MSTELAIFILNDFSEETYLEVENINSSNMFAFINYWQLKFKKVPGWRV